MNAGIFRDPLNRPTGLTVAGNANDIITELARGRLGTMSSFQATLPGKPDQIPPVPATDPFLVRDNRAVTAKFAA